MTREEAKREMMFAKRNVLDGSYIDQAYDKAIEALSQPERKRGDSFSRHEVYNALEEVRFASENEKRYAFNLLEQIPTAEPKWIPCSERLPKKHGESYLVTISDGAVYTAALQWDANGKRWYLSFLNDGNILVDFIDDVIAWMPLPEPWRGDAE